MRMIWRLIDRKGSVFLWRMRLIRWDEIGIHDVLEDILIRYYSYSWIFSKHLIYIAYIYILFFNTFLHSFSKTFIKLEKLYTHFYQSHPHQVSSSNLHSLHLIKSWAKSLKNCWRKFFYFQTNFGLTINEQDTILLNFIKSNNTQNL